MALFKKKYIKCEHCGKAINPKNEPNGEITYIDEKAWCVVCRLVNFPKSGKINYKIALHRKRDMKKFVDDVNLKKQIAQAKANDEVIDVAILSQNRANKIDPHTKLEK